MSDEGGPVSGDPVKSITIITPCLNAVGVIEPTIRSVFEQSAVLSGRLELQYLVCDGGSTDGTVERARSVGGDRLDIVSRADAGMYDALASGFERATGDIVAYINAGDRYLRRAFDTVADVMSTPSREVHWLTGLGAVSSEDGQIVSVEYPFRYRSRLIRRGVYGRRVGSFIQQESTFWARHLLETVDMGVLRGLRRAGDYYLWICFAAATELMIVEAVLASFTKHAGQISEDLDQYFQELEMVRETDSSGADFLLGTLDRILGLAPKRYRHRLNRTTIMSYDHGRRSWL